MITYTPSKKQGMKSIRPGSIEIHDVILKVNKPSIQKTRKPLTLIHHRHNGSVIKQEEISHSQESTEKQTIIQKQLQDFIELTFGETELSTILRFPILTLFTDVICLNDP